MGYGNNIARIILPLAALAFLCGCTGKLPDSPPDGAVFTKNFIQLYVIPDRMQLQGYPTEISVSLRGRRLSPQGFGEQAKKEFEELSIYYSDVSYNRRKVPYSDRALGKEYKTISVTCDR